MGIVFSGLVMDTGGWQTLLGGEALEKTTEIAASSSVCISHPMDAFVQRIVAGRQIVDGSDRPSSERGFKFVRRFWYT